MKVNTWKVTRVPSCKDFSCKDYSCKDFRALNLALKHKKNGVISTMESRWKSSRRPLFVKTVWSNGHHHVLLQKEETTPENKQQTKDCRRVKSSVTQTSRIIPKTEDSTKLLTVSTVRILLSGIRNFKDSGVSRCNSVSPRKPMVKTYTIDVIPTEQIKLRNINNEIVFEDRRTANEIKRESRVTGFRPTKEVNVHDNPFTSDEPAYYQEKLSDTNIKPNNFSYPLEASGDQFR